MSGYGMFEAAATDGFEEDQHRRTAQKNLAGAIYAARQQFGDFLGGAHDKADFDVRLALVKKELRACVEANGVMPVTGVMNKVVKAMKPDFRAREAAKREAAHKAIALRKKADEAILAPPGMVDYNQPGTTVDWNKLVYDEQGRPMGESGVVDRGWGAHPDLDSMSFDELMKWDQMDEWHNAKRKTAADWSKVDYGFEAENQTWKARDTNGNHLIVQQWLDNKPSWGVENSSGFSLNGGTADSVEEAQRKAEEASERLTFGASKKLLEWEERKNAGRKRAGDDKSSVEWFNEWDNRGNAGSQSADAGDPYHDRGYGDELDRDESRRRDDPSRKDSSRRTAALEDDKRMVSDIKGMLPTLEEMFGRDSAEYRNAEQILQKYERAVREKEGRKTAAPGKAYDPKNDWPGYLDRVDPTAEPAAEKNLLPADPGLEHEDADNHRNFTTSTKSLEAEMKEAFGEKVAAENMDPDAGWPTGPDPDNKTMSTDDYLRTLPEDDFMRGPAYTHESLLKEMRASFGERPPGRDLLAEMRDAFGEG